MPNYCENTLTLTASKPQMLDLLTKMYETNEFFNVVLPIPEVFLDIHSGGRKINGKYVSEWRTIDNKDTIINYIELSQLKAQYGVTNPIDWCYKYWGTKWDTEICEDLAKMIQNVTDEPSDTVSVSFELFNTAWNAPIALYYHLESIGFTVDAYFYEPGCAFYGWFYEGSECVESYDNFNEIPDYIVSMFAIENWDDEEDNG